MDRRDALRIGDAERDVAASELGDHFAAGRLSHEEFDERLEAAWRARSADDLRLLFTDLPTATAGAAPRRRSETVGVGAPTRDSHRPRRVIPLRLVVALIVMAAIVVPGPQWPLLLLLWVWIIVGRRHRGIGWGHCRPALQRAGR